MKRSRRRPWFGVAQFNTLEKFLHHVEVATELEGIFDIFVHIWFDVSLSQGWSYSTGSAISPKNYLLQNILLTSSEILMSINKPSGYLRAEH